MRCRNESNDPVVDQFYLAVKECVRLCRSFVRKGFAFPWSFYIPIRKTLILRLKNPGSWTLDPEQRSVVMNNG